MALYDVVLKPSVEKDLRALSATIRGRILARLEHLRGEPMPHTAINDAVAGMLAGTTIKAVLQIGTA